MKKIIRVVGIFVLFTLIACNQVGNTDEVEVKVDYDSVGEEEDNLPEEFDTSSGLDVLNDVMEEQMALVDGDDSFQEENENTQELTVDSSDAEGNEDSSEEDSEGESSNLIEVIDLTTLSSTMVFAEVYYMMVTPEVYEGKTVRMEGQFVVYENPDSGQLYFACVIEDATACCQQGVEFVLTEDKVYPDDYPEVGSTITVIGVYETYMEGEYLYFHLEDSVLQ
ncbi:MAG: hypothetical protein R3Y24_02530 [Eubacteriales bacterium]